jgi:hypothetical protein
MAIIDQKIKNSGIDPNYYTRIGGAESGGNDRAVNPTVVNGKKASASGRFQFTEATWKGVTSQYNLPYSLEDRFDKTKSQKVMELFTKDNADFLQKNGIETTNSNLYFAHFLGKAGAVRYIKKMQENPNQSVNNVATPSEIKWNKNIFINKDGSYKTAQEAFDKMANRVKDSKKESTNVSNNKDFENVTPNLTLLNIPIINSIFTGVSSLQEREQEVVVAKEDLTQKQNEEDFFNNYLNLQQEQAKPQESYQSTYEETPQQDSYDLITPYAQIEQFIEMQQGGFIQDNRGQWTHPGKLTEINSPNITMQGVDYEVLGISKQTGEQKLMKPNKNYYFKNTEDVLEIPQLQKYFK